GRRQVDPEETKPVGHEETALAIEGNAADRAESSGRSYAAGDQIAAGADATWRRHSGDEVVDAARDVDAPDGAFVGIAEVEHPGGRVVGQTGDQRISGLEDRGDRAVVEIDAADPTDVGDEEMMITVERQGARRKKAGDVFGTVDGFLAIVGR